MLVATDHPQVLTSERRAFLENQLRAFENVPENKQEFLRTQVFDSRILSPEGVDRLVSKASITVNTDHNRWIEYATPRYNWTDQDWTATNLNWLKEAGRDPLDAAIAH